MNAPETWPRCPQAAHFFEQQFHDFAAANPLVKQIAVRLAEKAGVDLLALVDHWIFPETPGLPATLTALGMTEQILPEGDKVWQHPQARLPRLRIKSKRTTPCLALGVEDIAAFAAAHALEIEACHGDADSRYQCAHLALPHGELMPIVRHGYTGFAPGTLTEADRDNVTAVRQAFRARSRTGETRETIAAAEEIAERAVTLLGAGRATDEFFAAERDYYLTRSRAARRQQALQAHVGIGWANHDHHTYRCSRTAFRALLHLWQTLGFVSRERFYAGAEAGWGAQIVAHPDSRVVLFCDVDVAPEELGIDFTAADLPERDALGTIGLWCALHGDSIGEAGMHHLECEFDFERAASLHSAGGVMPPFTDFPMLRQAFTQPEMWPVAPARLTPLLERGIITPEQAETFATVGAAGSHLEILQRWEGFNGFSKTGVSAIILATDARRAQP